MTNLYTIGGYIPMSQQFYDSLPIDPLTKRKVVVIALGDDEDMSEIDALKAAIRWLLDATGTEVKVWDHDPYGEDAVGFISYASDEYGHPVYPEDAAHFRLVKQVADGQ